MTTCEIYRFRSMYFLTGLSYLEGRGWTFDGFLRSLPSSLDAELLGDEVLEALRPRGAIDTAPDLKLALLAASGEKSWRSFQREARLVSVDSADPAIVIRLLVKRGGGFAAFSDSPKRIVRPEAVEVGKAVTELLQAT